MHLTIQQIAEAFSRHMFDVTYPYLLDTIQWKLVGDKHIDGKEDVISACQQTTTFLTEITTTFRRCKTVVGENAVVIESVAEYAGDEGPPSIVASCDLYDFVDGKLASITSYTIDLSAS